MNTAQFAMVCCQRGAEGIVKQELNEQGWRLAYSRSGFITVKRSPPSDCLPTGVFCRTASWSIGKAVGCQSKALKETLHNLVKQSLQKTGDASGDPIDYDQLHVWSRDRAAVGRFGFEPGRDEVSDAVGEDIGAYLFERKLLKAGTPNLTAEPGERVFDVVLVQPGEWWIGWHQATDLPSRWPGAIAPVQLPREVASRAYGKLAEAIAWSEFALRPDQTAIEIGSAPGGASQRLLELGLRVIGVDPAEMDPQVSKHPNFTHIRSRAEDLKQSVIQTADWLVVDANMHPNKTLAMTENLLASSEQKGLAGLLLTLKLEDYKATVDIPKWVNRVRSLGFPNVRVRHLATSRCEVCVAANR